MTDSQALIIRLKLARAGFTLNADLNLPTHGITVLYGPSGSGKTTLLRCIAGLEQASGVVSLNGEVWQDSNHAIFKPTWQRQIGYVFQEASLFEHLNVQENLEYGLRRRCSAAHTQSLDAAVELLGIQALLKRTPAGLSGGERQRVAIARSLATQPKLLLLDEPLASLDVARRQEILPWLERLHTELNMPMVYVTHSVDELARLADYVVMLDNGSVKTCGSVTQTMASPELALAIGDEAGVVATGTIVERDQANHMAQIEFAAGTVWGRDPGATLGQSVRLRILARDVSLSLTPQLDTTIQNRFPGVIEAIIADAHPSQVLVRVNCSGTIVLSRVTQRALQQLQLVVGTAVWCQMKSVALIV